MWAVGQTETTLLPTPQSHVFEQAETLFRLRLRVSDRSSVSTPAPSPTMGDEEFDSALDPPVRIFERLSQIVGYAWDESRPPTHSSYDNWYARPFLLEATA